MVLVSAAAAKQCLAFIGPSLRFPKEIILLGGAPGAGKETNTAFILKTHGLTGRLKKVFRLQVRFPGSEIRRG